jgi:hypothetical protein
MRASILPQGSRPGMTANYLFRPSIGVIASFASSSTPDRYQL